MELSTFEKIINILKHKIGMINPTELVIPQEEIHDVICDPPTQIKMQLPKGLSDILKGLSNIPKELSNIPKELSDKPKELSNILKELSDKPKELSDKLKEIPNTPKEISDRSPAHPLSTSLSTSHVSVSPSPEVIVSHMVVTDVPKYISTITDEKNSDDYMINLAFKKNVVDTNAQIITENKTPHNINEPTK